LYDGNNKDNGQGSSVPARSKKRGHSDADGSDIEQRPLKRAKASGMGQEDDVGAHYEPAKNSQDIGMVEGNMAQTGETPEAPYNYTDALSDVGFDGIDGVEHRFDDFVYQN
jgi:hypothetical protein